MEYLIKVGDKVPRDHPKYRLKWLSGMIIDKRPDGYYEGGLGNGNWGVHRTFHCVIRDNENYWTARGSTDWKSTLPAVMEFKKLMVTAHQQGGTGFGGAFSSGFKKRPHRYPWDGDYIVPTEGIKIRKRDWFIDFKELLDKGHINQTTFDAIFDPDVEHPLIELDFALSTSGLIKHRDQFSRRDHVHNEVIR